MPINVNAMRIHHPDRSTSWRRRMATASPGINRANELIVSEIGVPPNTIASKIVAATDTSMANKVHHQYSDRLDLVRKSKYLWKPDDIA